MSFGHFFLLSWLLLSGLANPALAQSAKDLPDPLRLSNGARIATVTEWLRVRRPELIELFTSQLYGRSPEKPVAMTFHVFDTNTTALGGKATRKQVAIYINGQLKRNNPLFDFKLL